MIENYFIFYKLHRMRSSEDNSRIKSQNDTACNEINQKVQTNMDKEKEETKKRLKIFLPYFIMIVIVLCINVFNLFFDDISSTKGFIIYVLTVIVFVIYSIIISHKVDKVVEKEIDCRLTEYRDNMFNLKYHLANIDITSIESYTLLIDEVVSKLKERDLSKQKVLDYTGKFIVCAFLPVAAAFFGVTKIVTKDASDYLTTVINVFLILILLYIVYMSVIMLSYTRGQKSMDFKRMYEDLSWIKAFTFPSQNDTKN